MATVSQGLLDTSIVISPDATGLPDEGAISAATLAELHFGVHVAPDAASRKARIRRLTEVESLFEPLPIDDRVARVYGELAHTMSTAGKRPRTRVMDILIAATAQANNLPLYTKNRADFRVFEKALEVRYV